jgi:hypothetical protein
MGARRWRRHRPDRGAATAARRPPGAARPFPADAAPGTGQGLWPIQSAVARLPFPDEQFDRIDDDALHHFADQRATIGELLRADSLLLPAGMRAGQVFGLALVLLALLWMRWRTRDTPKEDEISHRIAIGGA